MSLLVWLATKPSMQAKETYHDGVYCADLVVQQGLRSIVDDFKLQVSTELIYTGHQLTVIFCVLEYLDHNELRFVK